MKLFFHVVYSCVARCYGSTVANKKLAPVRELYSEIVRSQSQKKRFRRGFFQYRVFIYGDSNGVANFMSIFQVLVVMHKLFEHHNAVLGPSVELT